MPDLTRPYIVWGAELPAPYGPTGYGGGFIRPDQKGRIPGSVLEASWQVPGATSTRYAPFCIRENDLLMLVHSILKMLRDEEIEALYRANRTASVRNTS